MFVLKTHKAALSGRSKDKDYAQVSNNIKQQRTRFKDALDFIFTIAPYICTPLCRLHSPSNTLQQPLASVPQNPTSGKPRRLNEKHNCGDICLISGKAFDNFCRSHFVLKAQNISPCFLKCHDFLVTNNLASLIAYIFKHLIQCFPTSPLLIFCVG